MRELVVDFDLSQLSDRMLNILLRGSSESPRRDAPFVLAIHEQLAAEKISRETQPSYVAPSTFTFDPGFADGDREQIALHFRSLSMDIAALESAALLARTDSATHEEVMAGAEFLFRVAESLKSLLPTQQPS